MPDFISSESIVNPPISPLVAVMLPLIWASEAVICPLAPLSFSVPDVESKSSPMLNPPIVPVWAVILPLKFTFEAVILPSLVKWNLLELISMLPFERLTNWLGEPKKNFGVANVIWLPLMVALTVWIFTPLLVSYLKKLFAPSPA